MVAAKVIRTTEASPATALALAGEMSVELATGSMRPGELLTHF